MSNIIIGLTCGDINGIGLEVILKAVALKNAAQNNTIVIYGSTKVIAYHKNIITQENIQFHSVNSPEEALPNRMNIINCWPDNVNITLGKPNEVGGKCAFQALEQAVKDLRSGAIDALVTAPINKKAMQMSGFPFIGHTEYITSEFSAKESLMLMVSDTLRVGVVTNHLPIRDVAAAITKEKVLRKILIMAETLKIDFNLDRPTIAVLGLESACGRRRALSDQKTIKSSGQPSRRRNQKASWYLAPTLLMVSSAPDNSINSTAFLRCTTTRDWCRSKPCPLGQE